jgi:hypothetical protein
MSDIKLDSETADRIAVCALKEHFDYLKSEMSAENFKLLVALEIVINYFGETV